MGGCTYMYMYDMLPLSLVPLLFQPGSKTGSSPLPFLPSYSPETLLSSQDPSSLLSTLSITVSPVYTGQRRLKELLLPDNVSVLVERRESSKLESKEVWLGLGRCGL